MLRTQKTPSEYVYNFLIKQQSIVTCFDPLLEYWEEKIKNQKTHK